mmetsp:Transcript_91663/g.258292  ORF Transcript_91663/g.258292 Transcript_91663/m.258292 type:complete len:223 (+) Transcript_91663:546-1214(+)
MLTTWGSASDVARSPVPLLRLVVGEGAAPLLPPPSPSDEGPGFGPSAAKNSSSFLVALGCPGGTAFGGLSAIGPAGTSGPNTQDHSTCFPSCVATPLSFSTCKTWPRPVRYTDNGDWNEFASQAGAAMPLSTTTSKSRKKWYTPTPKAWCNAVVHAVAHVAGITIRLRDVVRELGLVEESPPAIPRPLHQITQRMLDSEPVDRHVVAVHDEPSLARVCTTTN